MQRLSEKEQQGLFSCDTSFCPHCGLILPLPGTSNAVECRLCGFQQATEVYEGFEEYSCKLFASRRENMPVGSSASKEGEGPMVDKRCPSCGNEEMSYTTQQTRSADEGQTVFYTCPKCKYKETENS